MAYKRISPQPVVEGGTGAVTLTNHSVLIGQGTSAVVGVGPIASTGAVLQSNGVGSDPGFSTATYPSIATGTGTVLRADGTNWVATTATYPATTAINEVLYSSSANVVAGITASNNGVLITGATGIPSWLAAGTTGQLLTATTGSPPTWAAPAGAGDVTAAINLTDNAVVRGDGGAKGVQTSTVLISDAGEMTNPSQPAFLAYVNVTIANVTGDSTVYTVIQDTEVFDQGADFNLAAGTFTAPVTGRYQFNVGFYVTGGTVITSAFFNLVTSNLSYFTSGNYTPGVTTAVNSSLSNLVDMDAADTAKVTIECGDSGGKIDDVAGLFQGERNFFSGYLAC